MVPPSAPWLNPRRTRLAARGRKRLRDFSWERTARAYRAVYRRAAGRQLSDEERDLLTSMSETSSTDAGNMKEAQASGK